MNERPKPYAVNTANTTPDEPRAGWYYAIGDDTRGPFTTRIGAEDSIDECSDIDGWVTYVFN